MSIRSSIRDTIIRHVLQGFGDALVVGGTISAAQEATLMPVALAVIGGIITIVSTVWGGKAATQISMVTNVANMPEVKRIVVTDPTLAKNTPAEVVYGRDMSIQ